MSFIQWKRNNITRATPDTARASYILSPDPTRRFHSAENKLKVFRSHYLGGIKECNNNRLLLLLFWICAWGKLETGKSRDCHDVIVFVKLRFHNVSLLRENEKPAFTNPSGLKSVYEKLRFREGLVWMAGLTAEMKRYLKFLLRCVSRV